MSVLLPSGKFSVHHNESDITLLENHTGAIIAQVNFARIHTELDPALNAIDHSHLSEEDKGRAVFWFGYFWGLYVERL